MPKYNDLSLRPQITSSGGGGGVSSITLENGVTKISGDTLLINAKCSGTLDVVGSIVRGSHTVSGILDVVGASTFRSTGKFINGLDVSGGATFKNITADSINTTGSASFGPLTVGGLSRLGTTICAGVTATSLTSTGAISGGSLVIGGTSSLQGGLSAGSLVISGTSSLQGGLTVSGASNLAGVSATTISTGPLTATGDTNLSTVTAGSVTVTGIRAIYSLIANGPSTLANVSATNITSTSLTSTGGLTVSGSTSLATTTTAGLTSTSISATSLASTSVSAGNVSTATLTATGASNMASLDLTGNFNVGKIYEKVNIVDAVSLVLDLNLGHSFVLPLSFLPTTNYSISIINVPSLDINNKTLSVSLINRQATTVFYVNNLKVSNVSNQYILGTSTTVSAPLWNGGVPSFTGIVPPCLMIQSFNILSIPDSSNPLGTYSRFVVSSVNCHY